MNAKRVILGVLGVTAILVVLFATIELQTLPDRREELVLRLIELWNGGDEEAAVAMFDPRVLSEPSKVASALQALRTTFGPVTLVGNAQDPPPFWPHRIGDVGKLSFVMRNFVIEFASGPALHLNVLLLSDGAGAGKIGQLEFQFKPGDPSFDKFGELCQGLGP